MTKTICLAIKYEEINLFQAYGVKALFYVGNTGCNAILCFPLMRLNSCAVNKAGPVINTALQERFPKSNTAIAQIKGKNYQYYFTGKAKVMLIKNSNNINHYEYGFCIIKKNQLLKIILLDQKFPPRHHVWAGPRSRGRDLHRSTAGNVDLSSRAYNSYSLTLLAF